jgi:hypothetical protein
MVTAEVFQRELAAFRDEMRIAFDRLRDEMHAGFDELRRADSALRDELHIGFGELRKEMQALDGALRVEIAKTPFETFKWLLAAAGLAAAIATAIYNIWFR